MILLDSCTFFWLTSDQKRLSAVAVEQVRANSTALFVSAITGFELALKHQKKGIALPKPPDIWFPQALTAHGIRELPLTSRIAVLATQIPIPHRDPFDRIIAATAKVHGLTLLSPDPQFSSYHEITVRW